MSKQPPPAPTASAVGPCLTVIKIVGRPGTGSLPSTFAPPDHPLSHRMGIWMPGTICQLTRICELTSSCRIANFQVFANWHLAAFCQLPIHLGCSKNLESNRYLAASYQFLKICDLASGCRLSVAFSAIMV